MMDVLPQDPGSSPSIRHHRLTPSPVTTVPEDAFCSPPQTQATHVVCRHTRGQNTTSPTHKNKEIYNKYQFFIRAAASRGRLPNSLYNVSIVEKV